MNSSDGLGLFAAVITWAVTISWTMYTAYGVRRAYRNWIDADTDAVRWRNNPEWGGPQRALYVSESEGSASDLFKIYVALFGEFSAGVFSMIGLLVFPPAPASPTVWYVAILRTFVAVSLIIGGYGLVQVSIGKNERRHMQRELLRKALPTGTAPEEID
jgi:hypothetical protein